MSFSQRVHLGRTPNWDGEQPPRPPADPTGPHCNSDGEKHLEETLQRLKQKAVLVAGTDFLCSLPASNVGVKARSLSRTWGCQGGLRRGGAGASRIIPILLSSPPSRVSPGGGGGGHLCSHVAQIKLPPRSPQRPVKFTIHGLISLTRKCLLQTWGEKSAPHRGPHCQS